MTDLIFFVLGFVLHASIPWTSHMDALALFMAAFCAILSLYGGGFATVPAYLADLFGTPMDGAARRPPPPQTRSCYIGEPRLFLFSSPGFARFMTALPLKPALPGAPR